MVRIVVDDDVVPIPEPVVGVGVVVGGEAEEEAAKTEALPVAAFQAVDVTGAEGAWETPMFPRTIEAVVAIGPAGVVSHPTIVLGIHVRGIGMPRRLGEIARRVRPRRRTTTILAGVLRGSAAIRGSRGAALRARRGRAVSRDM